MIFRKFMTHLRWKADGLDFGDNSPNKTTLAKIEASNVTFGAKERGRCNFTNPFGGHVTLNTRMIHQCCIR